MGITRTFTYRRIFTSREMYIGSQLRRRRVGSCIVVPAGRPRFRAHRSSSRAGHRRRSRKKFRGLRTLGSTDVGTVRYGKTAGNSVVRHWPRRVAVAVPAQPLAEGTIAHTAITPAASRSKRSNSNFYLRGSRKK